MTLIKFRPNSPSLAETLEEYRYAKYVLHEADLLIEANNALQNANGPEISASEKDGKGPFVFDRSLEFDLREGRLSPLRGCPCVTRSMDEFA